MTLKSRFLPYKTYFQNKTYSDSDRSLSVISREIIKFRKYYVVLELYAKMYVKVAKIRLRKKYYNVGTNEDISMKI